jgi:hypothetical protein
MTNSNREFVVPSRQPAARVAGQRRRLSRPPPRVPHSNTLSVLNRELSSGGRDGGVGDGNGPSNHTSPQEGATGMHAQNGATPLEASQSMMNLRTSSRKYTQLRVY